MASYKKAFVENNEVYDNRVNEDQNSLMSRKELPGWTQVSVRLSNNGVNIIRAIIANLRETLPDFKYNLQGDVLAVSGYPPSDDFGPHRILAIVQEHDPNAALHN